jgi:chromate reductase
MITIVSSTNQQNSRSRQVAGYYQRLLAQMGTPSEVLDLADLPVDFIQSALYQNVGKHDDFNRLRDAVESAEKLVFILPEYNGSFPGVLKAFLDGFHYPSKLMGKTAALVGISDGPGGCALGLSHWADILSFMGCTALGLRVRVPYLKTNLVDGEIQDAFMAQLFRQQAEQLVGVPVNLIA